jgi:hypothetical protein
MWEEAIVAHLSGGTENNHEKSLDIPFPSRDSNRGPSEYTSAALQLSQIALGLELFVVHT